MSKIYQNKKKNQSSSGGENLTPIQIDETIISGQVNKHRDTFKQELIASMTSLIEQMESMGLVNPEDCLEDDDFEIEEFEAKIKLILKTNDLEVNSKTLNRYLKYLKDQVKSPCYLTGTEEFDWEEEYLFGAGTKKEYEKLKQTKPSYTDVFLLTQFNNTVDDIEGILVDVKRVTDNRKFTLPLAELEVTEQTSANYQLIEDYLTWFVNYL